MFKPKKAFIAQRRDTKLDYRTAHTCFMLRVGQNRIYTPYMTVYLVISLPKIPYIHRIYMVLANPIHAFTLVQQLGKQHIS